MTRKKSRKQRVDDVTILTSQKVRQGLPQLCQEGCGTEGSAGTQEKGNQEGAEVQLRAEQFTHTHTLCCDEWRHEIQLVNPEISRD